MGRLDTWRETRLWEELEGRDGEPTLEVRQVLEQVLPPVEIVLNKGGTTSLTSTLHDAEHSWRVAQWMAEVAGDELLAAMQPYDLAMLFLSAYLHDIGMTPEAGKIDHYSNFLISGKSRSLSEEEIDELQDWLDESWGGLVPPVDDDEPSSLTQEIVDGYVRHRHNDWSGPWIREYLAPQADKLYQGWIDDLIRLCQSHHFGIRELKDEDFDPKLVGESPQTVLHLRYCACLLRLADILDFDPERTPPILFKHRNVKGESVIHWRRALGVSITLLGRQLQLKAKPDEAAAHRAIIKAIADIEHELALCQQLDDETDFQRMVGGGSLPHRWQLDLGIKFAIKPRDDTYEYIDGSFRPDVQRLLALLGGVELYGDHQVAVRELLQNAFDAVREQIARERLGQSDPADVKTRNRIARKQSVSLVIEPSESGVRLVCRDSGVGMSKQAITDRFLVGGTTSSHDLVRLQRTCKEKGFSVGRTARFGIGVLSYFMLAKRLVLRTRPSSKSDTPKEQGWTFTSYGLGDFGELRRSPLEKHGTEVELELKLDELGISRKEFAQGIAEYVLETVKNAPCRFSFSAPAFELPELSFGPGWPDHDDLVREELLFEFSVDDDLEDDEESSFWRELPQKLELSVHEGELPDGLGSFRIFLGYFRLDPGRSLACLNLKRLNRRRYSIENVGDPDGWLLPGKLKFSWNGMEIEPEWEFGHSHNGLEEALPDARSFNAYVEVDWTSDDVGRLAVDRNYFTPSPVVMEMLQFIDQEAAKHLVEFANANQDSSLALLNAHLVGEFPAKLKIPPYWAHSHIDGDKEDYVLAPLSLPAICAGEDPGDFYRDSYLWRGKKTPKAIGFNIAEGENIKRNHRCWFGDLFGPQYVGAIEDDNGLRPVLIWDKYEPNDVPSGHIFHFPAKFAQFPPEWTALATFMSSGDRNLLNAWNPENPLCRIVDKVAWEWALATFEESKNPLPHREEILLAPSRVAAWILMLLYEEGEDLWNELATSEPEFLDEAWGLIRGLEDDSEIFSAFTHKDYKDGRFKTTVRVLTKSRWWREPMDDTQAFKRRLGAPDAEWLVTRA